MTDEEVETREQVIMERLIEDKKLINRLQIDSFKNPLHIISENCKIIDQDRKNIIYPIKKFNINLELEVKLIGFPEIMTQEIGYV